MIINSIELKQLNKVIVFIVFNYINLSNKAITILFIVISIVSNYINLFNKVIIILLIVKE